MFEIGDYVAAKEVFGRHEVIRVIYQSDPKVFRGVVVEYIGERETYPLGYEIDWNAEVFELYPEYMNFESSFGEALVSLEAKLIRVET